MISSLIISTALQAAIASAAVPSIPGFQITWSEDFEGTQGTLPSSTNWIVDTGTGYTGGPANWGTGEIQSYTNSPQNLALNGNGALSITALRDSAGAWTSARIETSRADFQAAAGGKMRIQASINMPATTGPAAVGYWPAFWTLGGNYRGNFQNWPAVGEFDIMENVNGLNKVTATLHCDVAPGGTCNEMDGLGNSLACPGTTCQGNFHTYTLEVDRSATPEMLRYFVDGTMYHNVSSTQLGDTLWAQTVHHGHFILLNLAIGGSFPDKVYGSKTPLASTVPGSSLLVDYVAVYNS